MTWRGREQVQDGLCTPGTSRGASRTEGGGEANQQVGALLILNYDVRDHGALTEYRAAASQIILGATGRVLASTVTTTHLPEAPEQGARSVVIWYASRTEALRCYVSTDYQSLLPARLSATTPRVAIIVEALSEPVGVKPVRALEKHRRFARLAAVKVAEPAFSVLAHSVGVAIGQALVDAATRTRFASAVRLRATPRHRNPTLSSL